MKYDINLKIESDIKDLKTIFNQKSNIIDPNSNKEIKNNNESNESIEIKKPFFDNSDSFKNYLEAT